MEEDFEWVVNTEKGEPAGERGDPMNRGDMHVNVAHFLGGRPMLKLHVILI